MRFCSAFERKCVGIGFRGASHQKSSRGIKGRDQTIGKYTCEREEPRNTALLV